jgi:HEAT repeat protein
VRDVRALTEHYLLEWDSDRWANAYHSLIELGPQVLPELERRLGDAPDSVFRAALVELARQLHSTDAVRLFDTALRDESPRVWKEALDGLVDLASPASILLLEQALARTPPGHTDPTEWGYWLREALQQARAESRRPRREL